MMKMIMMGVYSIYRTRRAYWVAVVVVITMMMTTMIMMTMMSGVCSTYSDKKDLLDKLEAITWRHGVATNTGAGIEYMREVQMAKARPIAAHVCIVITDGQSQEMMVRDTARARGGGGGWWEGRRIIHEGRPDPPWSKSALVSLTATPRKC